MQLGYVPYRLGPIADIIIFTQKNKNKIKKEFKKLSEFFLANPEAFYYSLETSKEYFENKEVLTDFEYASLEEINKMLQSSNPVKEYFKFRKEFLIDDYSKIYSQISKQLTARDLLENPVIDIIFYSLNLNNKPTSPVGSVTESGFINTGSLLQMEVMRIESKEFISQYQTFYN